MPPRLKKRKIDKESERYSITHKLTPERQAEFDRLTQNVLAQNTITFNVRARNSLRENSLAVIKRYKDKKIPKNVASYLDRVREEARRRYLENQKLGRQLTRRSKAHIRKLPKARKELPDEPIERVNRVVGRKVGYQTRIRGDFILHTRRATPCKSVGVLWIEKLVSAEEAFIALATAHYDAITKGGFSQGRADPWFGTINVTSGQGVNCGNVLGDMLVSFAKNPKAKSRITRAYMQAFNVTIAGKVILSYRLTYEHKTVHGNVYDRYEVPRTLPTREFVFGESIRRPRRDTMKG